jgi:dienelactone hydrolase
MEQLHIDRYYPTMDHLLDYYDQNARQHGFHAAGVDGYAVWKKELRGILFDITGLNRMTACDKHPQLLESCRMDGYRRDKVLIETEDKVFMPFYMLVPDGMQHDEKRPCVIATHGHGCGPYPVAGVQITDSEGIYPPNGDYGVRFVREGYVVFCPNARAMGERREPMHQGDDRQKLLTASCTQLNYAALCLGQTVTGMWVWDLMRLIDHIETLPFCDVKQLCCAGHSGGGLQSLWLGALDDRVTCTVVSGFFHGYKDSILRTNMCGCNYVPHLYETCDMGDLGALIAPRALLIESGTEDALNGHRGIADVREQFDITARAYTLLGARDKLYHHVFPGGHVWNAEKTYDFVRKQGDGSPACREERTR